MDVEALRRSPIGQLVPITGHDPRIGEEYEYVAFVPDPLPASFDLKADTYAAVIDAAAAMARADQASSLLPNPGLLARPATRREAVSTSALEGTYAFLSDVFEADFLEDDELTSSVSEVRNYVTAAERAYEMVAEGQPISVRMLEDLQRELLRGTTSDGSHAGSVRTTQVFIGLGNRRVTSARFVPPPADHRLLDGLLQWQDWVRGSTTIPTIIRVAVSHYQFETLHPFHDGNGRLGRLVMALQLMSAGDLQFPVLNISPWLEQHRAEYQDGLLRVSQTGDWDEWVCFISAAIHAEALEVIDRVDKLLALREGFQETLRGAKGVSLRIADDLVGYPMITASVAATLHGVSYQAANTAIAKLVEKGILRQRTTGRYDRIFQCDSVLTVLEY
ncbi:Fic family protein [Mycolicibacterium smegmatis]|uniref:Fic protein family protein n=1 Tax=Mycolicibacterium smegmatis (strain MKD8) TaxID=1214915 RepID=A0A2U9PYY7_MYCSE|nr:Fic/DOC family N-terminal domain-containing protein [Mycolicibacterium smegmatis]AWT57039.1 Fic protein family protein [Mycolicibacterium smegmatis MKD8]